MKKKSSALSGNWYRLDNSATVYPMMITLKTQSIYRLGVELNDFVDKPNLVIALNKTLLRYPFFKVELKRGWFRHYFEENLKPPVIEEDDGILLKNIDFHHNHRYLFRVTYYRNKIFLDLFHALCDGRGGIEFLKTLVYYYLKECGFPIESENKVKLYSEDEKIPVGETEDGFIRYFKKISLIKGTKAMMGESAFGVRDELFQKEGFGSITGFINTMELRALSHRFGCSVTVLVSAIAMLAVAKNYYRGPQKRNLMVFIPINLRNVFPSETMFNFTTFAKCVIPKDLPQNLSDYVKAVSESLKRQMDKDLLQLKLNFSSLLSTNFFLRALPLPIKSFITKLSRFLSRETRQTMIVSNLGIIDMPSDCGKYVEDFIFNLNCSQKTPVNIGLLSYKSSTIISFTRQIIPTNIERDFFRILTDLGASVGIISNLREVEDAL